MKYKDDLKIELRAIPYDDEYHVLQWRIDPNQNLEYTSNIFGIEITKKYDTDWHQPEIFKFNPFIDSPCYSENSSRYYKPILFDEKKKFECYKQYKTFKELFDRFTESENWDKRRYRDARERYLEKTSVWK